MLADTALYIGVGIADLINLLSPEQIILGGWAGLLLGERMLAEVREAARHHSLHYPFAGTSIELGRLGRTPSGLVLPRSRSSISSMGRAWSGPGPKMAAG